MRILNLERSKFFIDRTHLRNTVSLMLLKECLCNMQILDGPLNFPGATEDAQFLIVVAWHCCFTLEIIQFYSKHLRS
ncbi:hypothetical protein ZWY2020_024655 [Hordeum vulgare]|nr:hypothetical protein ZWY2020_024655 [Hordeum vulgare]